MDLMWWLSGAGVGGDDDMVLYADDGDIKKNEKILKNKCMQK